MIVPGFNFVYWEYDPERKGELDKRSETYVMGGIKRDGQTKAPTGYYFRWYVKLYSTNGLFLHCMAEDSYREMRITPPSAQRVWEFIKHSHEQFLEKFAEKAAIIHFNYAPTFDLKMESAELLYQEYLQG